MNWFYQLSPLTVEIFLSITAMLLLLVGVYGQSHNQRLVFRGGLLVVLVSLGLLWLVKDANVTVLNGLYLQNAFTVGAKLLLLLATAGALILAYGQMSESRLFPFEYPVLLLLSVVGMCVLISAQHFMLVYMGIELMSLPLYVLAAIRRDEVKSAEAGLKYFMLGALASGLLLFGMSFIYGFVGSLSFVEVADVLSASEQYAPLGTLFGIIFILIGLAFKISAVPFHMWTPDVYEGAPKAVTALFASVPKIAVLALLMRLLQGPFAPMQVSWEQIFIVLSLASIAVGAFGALKQTNFKRLLAYSSIGHIGFALLPFAVGLPKEAAEAVAIYMSIYVFMNAGVFGCVMRMQQNGEHVSEIKDLAGVAKPYPVFALCLTVLMFSMAGIPPLAGFFAKFYVIKAVIAAGSMWLAAAAVLLSVVSAFYYLRIIKVMYFEPHKKAEIAPAGLLLTVLLGITVLFNLAYFIYPNLLLEIVYYACKVL